MQLENLSGEWIHLRAEKGLKREAEKNSRNGIGQTVSTKIMRVAHNVEGRRCDDANVENFEHPRFIPRLPNVGQIMTSHAGFRKLHLFMKIRQPPNTHFALKFWKMSEQYAVHPVYMMAKRSLKDTMLK